jgi:nucleoside-diphosphate-sugar epimerase
LVTPSKIALITGATGYIGSELANHLSRQGWVVNVIVRPKSDRYLLERQGSSSCFLTHLYDGTAKSLLAAVEKSQPDVVFHLASAVLSEPDPDNIDSMLEANIRFGVHLAQAMSSMGVTKLVNTGTFWQHYDGKPYDPVNLYAATKQALEALLQFYVSAHGFSVINLKLFDTYGENDPRPKLLNLLKKTFREGTPLAMSPGDQKVDLVHVDDVVKAYETAAGLLISGRVDGMENYVVSSGQRLTLRALLKLIEDMTGKSLPIQWGERPYRDREIMEPMQGRCLPRWNVQIDIQKGISRLFNG